MKNYAFIDSQNLNLGTKADGWSVDYRKLRVYLKNKYKVEKAFMFIGFIDGNQKLYSQLQAAGFILVFKPTVRYRENGKETVKGNVDAELVLHAAAIEYASYEQAIIITGDGDFTCLVEFLEEKQKLLYVLAPNKKFSSLLRRFDARIKRLSSARKSLEYKKTRTSGRSKP